MNLGNLSYVGLLVDSEQTINDFEKPWDHLKARDKWIKPDQATDDNVFLMTTCTETWLIADIDNLKSHFGQNFNEKILPKTELESREKNTVIDSLVRSSNGKYKKGESTFEILGKANPTVLSEKLPSFARMIRILNEKLS
jgi:hypothetical protein